MYWTYAANDRQVTFLEHPSLDAAAYHYDMMRTYGGPKRVGICRKRMKEEEIRKYAETYFADLERKYMALACPI